MLSLFLLVSSAQAQDLDEIFKQLGDNPALAEMLGNTNVELEKSYQYDLAITYQVESPEQDEPLEIKQLLSKGKTYLGMQMGSTGGGNNMPDMGNMMTVLDIDRSLMVLLSPDEKQAIVMAFDPQGTTGGEEGDNLSDTNIEKTGNTKKILGYTCYEYRVSGKEGNGEMWVTHEIEHEGSDIFTYLSQLQQGESSGGSFWGADIDGFIMEIKGEDPNGGAFSMMATAVDAEAGIAFQMDEFQVIDLSAMQKMQKGN
jgi:hypothetical protein